MLDTRAAVGYCNNARMTATPPPDGVPLWLKVVLGAVPLVAALIAGAVALANTASRRIERLKNLADAREKLPNWMNVRNSIDRLIVDELAGIERTLSPVHRWHRRARWVLNTAFFATWMVGGVSLHTGWRSALPWFIAAFLALLVDTVLFWSTKKRREKAELPHDVRVAVIKHLNEERQKSRESDKASSTGDVAADASNDGDH